MERPSSCTGAGVTGLSAALASGKRAASVTALEASAVDKRLWLKGGRRNVSAAKDYEEVLIIFGVDKK
ncbi:putative flavoprotein YhiN [Caballeronia udeis]|jgi:predicted flavoprotein YhiN|uniref:Flavoprotein YhiN n=1 Tax=Caballeronia udeis TaxID=1232866 RepID=A0ABW8MEG2_9BURK